MEVAVSEAEEEGRPEPGIFFKIPASIAEVTAIEQRNSYFH